MKIIRFLPALAIVALHSTSSHAALVVYDGFNYGTSGQALSSVATPTATGLTGTWGNPTTAGSSAVISTGLTFANFSTSGNAVTVTAGTAANSQAFSSRAIDSSGALPADGSTLYSSFLFQPVTAFPTGKSFSVQVSNDGVATNNTPRPSMQVTSAGTNNATVVLKAGTSATAAYSSTPAAGTTYLAVASFTNMSSVASGHVLDMWILDASQWTSIYDQTITASLLSANSIAHVTYSGAATGALDFTSSDFIKIGANGSGSTAGNPVIFDEIRFGQSFSDVLVVPEPNGAALAIAGIGIIFTFKRFVRRSVSRPASRI